MANNIFHFLRLIAFYFILGISSLFSVDFILDFQVGAILLTEQLSTYSNNVYQNENRIITDRTDQAGVGIELTTTFLLNDHLSIGPGFAYYRAFTDYGQTNLSNSTTHTNYVTSLFPIWFQVEYYLKPKTQKFNISFLTKIGGILQLTESFRYVDNQLNPNNVLSFGGVMVIPSVKFIYGIWTYSHIYIEFQYPLIISSYLRHFAYLGIGLKYRFRYSKPKEKNLINLPNIGVEKNKKIEELKDNINK